MSPDTIFSFRNAPRGHCTLPAFLVHARKAGCGLKSDLPRLPWPRSRSSRPRHPPEAGKGAAWVFWGLQAQQARLRGPVPAGTRTFSPGPAKYPYPYGPVPVWTRTFLPQNIQGPVPVRTRTRTDPHTQSSTGPYGCGAVRVRVLVHSKAKKCGSKTRTTRRLPCPRRKRGG